MYEVMASWSAAGKRPGDDDEEEDEEEDED